MNSHILILSLSNTQHAHSNKHKCPHLVPSVGCPSSSALAIILFHPSPFFLSLNVFVQIWNRDEGHFVQGLFLVGDRLLLSPSPLTLHPLGFPVLLHLLLGLGKLGIWISPPPLKLVLSSLVFKILLPSAYLPCDPSLPICVFSSSVSMFLLLSEVLDPWEPEDPREPLGPWVKAGPTNMPFCTLSHKDMDASHANRRTFTWSALLKSLQWTAATYV